MPFVWPGTACDGDRAVFTERERTKLVAPTRDRFQEVVAARLRLALTRVARRALMGAMARLVRDTRSRDGRIVNRLVGRVK